MVKREYYLCYFEENQSIKMKNSILFVLLIGLSFPQVGYSQKTPVNSNYLLTSDFYNQLISSTSPNVALLNLFFTNMPKGGDLHHHYTGTIYAETYVDWVELKGWKIDSCSLEIVKSGQISDKNCTLLSVQELKSNTALYRTLLTLWSDKDFNNHDHLQPAPDLNFFNTFSYFGLVSDEYMNVGLNIIKQRAIKENVSYIETMLTAVGISSGDFFSSAKSSGLNTSLEKTNSQEKLDLIFDEIVSYYSENKKFKRQISDFTETVSENHKGIDNSDFTMRYQTYAVRVLDPLQVFTDLYSGFLSAELSPLIVGVNIVAPENNITALKDYTLHMRMYNYLSRKFPKVHKALHAGELTLGMVRPKNLLFHINQALDIAGAERIGHGVDIPYESGSIETLEKIKERSAIEINLTSNEFILGVKGNKHPYLIYAAYDAPLVISTDDSGVSRNNLSGEYVLLASRYKPPYSTVKKYVYNSIKYSFLTPKEKQRLVDLLDKKFISFEQEIAALTKKLKL